MYYYCAYYNIIRYFSWYNFQLNIFIYLFRKLFDVQKVINIIQNIVSTPQWNI